MKEAFKKMVRAAEKSLYMDKEMTKIGYSGSLYADIFGDIADAIYEMLGENVKTFESSFTYVLLHTDVLTLDSKAILLEDRFRKHLAL